MRRFFPEAEVDGYQDLVDQMTNHPKDRHVLAAAVAARADFIVNANLRDFPVHALDPHAVEALHLTTFCATSWTRRPAASCRSCISRPTRRADTGTPNSR